MLRRLRDVMARSSPDQDRLARITDIVAAEMAAEVCSIYMRRPDNDLELCATFGLNPGAVGRTRLRVGEGLVGDIAARSRPLALSDAQSHPKFAYRPETGEEIYQSLMGVPVLRSERLLGVLVVQNRTRRQYADEEIETLETFAMVLADLLSEALSAAGSERDRLAPIRYTGLSIVSGLAVGQAWVHRRLVPVRAVAADDPEAERQRLEAAFDAMNERIGRLVDEAALSTFGDHAEVLAAYRMFARSRGWLRRMREAVDSGLTAETAVQHSLSDMRARAGRISDPYLRERLADFEALAEDLLEQMSGNGDAQSPLPDDAVVFARNMGPADLLAYDRDRLRAVVLEEGSPTAHVAIVARALDIPCIGRTEGILNDVEPGDAVVVDAENAQVFLRPDDAVRTQVDRSLEARRLVKARFVNNRDRPCVTRDGTAVALLLNAGMLIDMPQLAATGADGIGLYRTEIPFISRRKLLDVDAQVELYQRIFDSAGGKPVTFRLLDIGGDKRLQSLPPDVGDNPSMGWRSLRILLDRPAILRHQVRSLIKAAAGRDLRIMVPMVASIREFDQARAVVNLERAFAADHGLEPPRSLVVGAMIEIPALLWQIEELACKADFMSVGTNDLLQFAFAADRNSDRMTARYDPLSVSFLRMIARIAKAGDQAGRPLTVCGEMAGRPVEALALLGVGVRRLSMNASSIGPVKEMLIAVDHDHIADLVRCALGSGCNSIRGILTDYARDHGIPI